MSYPSYMTNEDLKTYGFKIKPDKPNTAFCERYPTLSYRHQCDTCGIWSSVYGGEIRECPRCFQGKEPFKVTKQSYKLYLCCEEDNCPIHKAILPILWEAGLEFKKGYYDRYGAYLNLDKLRTLSEDQRVCFFMSINNFSVSKFRARLLVHEKSNAKSKLTKSRA